MVFSDAYFEHCPYLGIQFPLGVLFAAQAKQIGKRKSALLLLPLVAICAFLEIKFAGNQGLLENRIFRNIGSTCGALAVLGLTIIFDNCKLGFLEKIGKVSFPIYLVEAPVIYHNAFIPNRVAALAVDFLAIFAVAIILNKILELIHKKVSLCHTHQ